jgi:prolyl oligopeptidase
MHAPTLGAFLLALVAACAAPPSPAGPPPRIEPPRVETQVRARTPEVSTRTVDSVDDFFGEKVKDPYRWLEDDGSPEVKAWIVDQNALTRRALDAIPGREGLNRRITDLLQIGLVSAPEVREARAGLRRYFHAKREGTQNQPVLYVRDGVSGKDRVLVDPAGLSADATTALDWWFPSNDGALLAWGGSEKGSEDSTLFVRDVATGKDLPDKIPYTRHGSVAWLPGNKAFYYTRYPAPGSVPAGDEKYFRKAYLHVIGQDYRSDKLVFGDGRDKTDYTVLHSSPDGRHLVAEVSQGWGRSEIFTRDLTAGEAAPWVPVAVGIDALFNAIAHNDRLYLHTNDEAPRYRLVAVDYARPERSRWTTVLPEGPDVIEGVALIGKDLFATLLHDAATRLERFTLDGHSRGGVELPSLGSASVSGAWNGDEAFVSFESFVVPPIVKRIDLKVAAGGSTIWDQVGASFVASGVSVTQMSATSKDGTRVPMFVVQKEGTPHDGTAPTVMWGYGGFNVNQTPGFSARALVTVERGGIWVSAVLRGGGEFGEAWHRAGMLGNKQNVFDDAAACLEKLAVERVTSPSLLGVMGGSNGGLLVAALATQHPKLFRVGVSLVPLTDMLRYERFRIAKLWVPEYGSASDPEQFRSLYAYSPYHHVREGEDYPSMLFTTAESDSRVDPMHALKMAARMQAAQHADHPILLRVESRAGHGQGKPVSKVVAELTDEMGFVLHELGVTL